MKNRKRPYRVKELSARRMHGYTGMSRGLARLTGFRIPKGADGAIRRRLPRRERMVTARHEEIEDRRISKGDSQIVAHRKAMQGQSRTKTGRDIVFIDSKKSTGRAGTGRTK